MTGDNQPDPETQGYAREYSEAGFWTKVKGFAAKAGREVVERALQLYLTAQDPDTPRWAQATIYSALGYFIFPADAVPDLTPVVGFTDDLGVLAAAIATVAMHITPDIRNRAREKSDEWLGTSAKNENTAENSDRPDNDA